MIHLERLFLLICCIWITSSSAFKLKQGEIDLTLWNSKDPVSVELTGEWQFYPDTLLTTTPDTSLKPLNMNVPMSWNNSEQPTPYPYIGYGTYRARITLPTSIKRPLLYTPIIYHAGAVIQDGRVLGEVGRVSSTSKEMIPVNTPSIFVLHIPDSTSETEILIQVSNFNHRNGGLRYSPRLGVDTGFFKVKTTSMIIQTLIIGSLLFMMLYHLFTYLAGLQNRSMLLFALLCGLVGIRISMGDNYIFQILLKDLIPFTTMYRIEYITVVLISLSTIEFYRALFQEKRTKLLLLFQILAILQIAFYFTTPVSLFSSHIWMIYLNAAFAAIIVIRNTVIGYGQNRVVAVAFLGGALILIGTVVLDSLFYAEVIPIGPWVNYGFLTFMVIQAVMIAHHFIDLYNKSLYDRENLNTLVDRQTRILKRHNERLSREIQHHKEEENRLKILSQTDPLTGAYNRQAFEQYWEEITLEDNMTMILFDIDHFKLINDDLGHSAGDIALKSFVFQIKSLLRDSDLFFRWGGEEFVVLAPISDEKNALAFAERLRSNIAQKSVILQNRIVTCSIGLTVFTSDEPQGEVFQRADTALYTAKESGRNRAIFQGTSSI